MLFFVLIIPDFLGSVNVYQTLILKSNGSGSINLQFNAKDTVLKNNNFIVDNYPFNEELAKQYFSSPTNLVKSARLDYSIKDSVYFITVEVEFEDINRLSEATGFSNVKASLEKSDDSTMVFKYILLKDLNQLKNIGTLSYIVNFENPVVSTNGVLDGNKVIWGSRSTTNTDFTQDVELTATIKVNEQGASNSNRCGLCGLELPVIFLAGMFFMAKGKKK